MLSPVWHIRCFVPECESFRVFTRIDSENESSFYDRNSGGVRRFQGGD